MQLGDWTSPMMHLFGVQTYAINYWNLLYTKNEALRIATGCHKMSSVAHLHVEAEMLNSYYLHIIWLDAWNQRMSATLSPQGNPQETDEGDNILQTSQHWRTNDVTG